MNNLSTYIVEKLRINKDTEIIISSEDINENILWGIIYLIEDFGFEYTFFKDCKFKLKPSYIGNNIVVNVCFEKMNGAMWHSLKLNFEKFIEGQKETYLKDKKIIKYSFPPVQKGGLQKIRFYIDE